MSGMLNPDTFTRGQKFTHNKTLNANIPSTNEAKKTCNMVMEQEFCQLLTLPVEVFKI